MLSKADVEWIKGNRKEVTSNRQSQITIAYAGESTKDEITGEEIAGKPETREVMSVVTEITTLAEAGIERLVENGVIIEKGDLWLSISYDQVSDINGRFDRILYDGVWYSVLASDKKGIGTINRIEVVGRVIS